MTSALSSCLPRAAAKMDLHQRLPHGICRGDPRSAALNEGQRLKRLVGGLRYSLRNGTSDRDPALQKLKSLAQPSPTKKSREDPATAAAGLQRGLSILIAASHSCVVRASRRNCTLACEHRAAVRRGGWLLPR